MSRRAFVVALLALAGCGGPDSADEVREAWVDAVRAHDWERACDLSVPAPADAGFDCEEILELGMRQSKRGPDARGLQVERVDGEWKVHFEIQVIR
jgi:hypothetical protein